MIRSELREHVFKMVFQIEFNEPADMPEHFELYIDSLERATDQDRTYIETKYKAVLEKISEIDALIDEKSKDWKTKRMNKADLAILRLAVYEMKWDEDVPVGVAINEAVELAKRFSGESGPAYQEYVHSGFHVEPDLCKRRGVELQVPRFRSHLFFIERRVRYDCLHYVCKRAVRAFFSYAGGAESRRAWFRQCIRA